MTVACLPNLISESSLPNNLSSTFIAHVEVLLFYVQVADLRTELGARGMTEKGIRSQLIARLTKAIKSEQQKEEQEDEKKEEEVRSSNP